MRRFATPLLALALLAVSLVGCFQDEIVVKVNPDGSGTIERTFVLSRTAIEEMRAIQAGFDPDTPFSIFNKEELHEKAAELGEGVRFVSAEPLETEAGDGYRAVYAFDDVTTLDIQPQSGGRPSGDGAKPGVRFAFAPGTPARLTILVPQQDDTAPTDPVKADTTPADSTERAGMMTLMHEVLRGLHIRLVVEPQGTISETNAAFRADGRVVLVDVAGDALLSDPALVQQLAGTEDPAATRSLIAGANGVQMETQEHVTVSFE